MQATYARFWNRARNQILKLLITPARTWMAATLNYRKSFQDTNRYWFCLPCLLWT